jgi:hypothetical protein
MSVVINAFRAIATPPIWGMAVPPMHRCAAADVDPGWSYEATGHFPYKYTLKDFVPLRIHIRPLIHETEGQNP